MPSIIRTQTFLRYARMHLQEAEAALREERQAAVISLCSDTAVAIIKALKAGLPPAETRAIETDERALNKALVFLTGDKKEAGALARSLVELRQGPERGSGRPPSKGDASAAFQRAEEICRSVHDLFAL